MCNTVKARKAALVAGVLVALSPVSNAADTATATLAVTINVQESPCVINNNQTIYVEFGEVTTTKVDGNNYRKVMYYTLECDSSATNIMIMQVQGTGASFDSTLLQTSNDALAIKFQAGETLTPINSPLYFTYPNMIELSATPVKQNGVTLRGDEFTAVATMKVEYF